MSCFWQSRNVAFYPRFSGCHVNLHVPVKQRWALLASTPSRNNRPELIATVGKDVLLHSRPIAWFGPD